MFAPKELGAKERSQGSLFDDVKGRTENDSDSIALWGQDKPQSEPSRGFWIKRCVIPRIWLALALRRGVGGTSQQQRTEFQLNKEEQQDDKRIADFSVSKTSPVPPGFKDLVYCLLLRGTKVSWYPTFFAYFSLPVDNFLYLGIILTKNTIYDIVGLYGKHY